MRFEKYKHFTLVISRQIVNNFIDVFSSPYINKAGEEIIKTSFGFSDKLISKFYDVGVYDVETQEGIISKITVTEGESVNLKQKGFTIEEEIIYNLLPESTEDYFLLAFFKDNSYEFFQYMRMKFGNKFSEIEQRGFWSSL